MALLPLMAANSIEFEVEKEKGPGYFVFFMSEADSSLVSCKFGRHPGINPGRTGLWPPVNLEDRFAVARRGPYILTIFS